MAQYAWSYDYDGGPIDGEADPPHIWIMKDGWRWLEVDEEPMPLVEKPQCEDAHWQIPPIVERLVELLNTHLKEQ